jgi:hypothetical protein
MRFALSRTGAQNLLKLRILRYDCRQRHNMLSSGNAGYMNISKRRGVVAVVFSEVG